MAKSKKKAKADEIGSKGKPLPATIPEENENEIEAAKAEEKQEKVELVDRSVMALGAVSGHDAVLGATAQTVAKSAHMGAARAWGQHDTTAGVGRGAPVPAPKQTVFGPASDGYSENDDWDDQEEYESYSEDDSPPMAAEVPGWQSWHEEERKLSKVNNHQAPPGLPGSKAQLSSQQWSLPNQAPQNNYAQSGAHRPAWHRNPYPGQAGHVNAFPGHASAAAGHNYAFPGQRTAQQAGLNPIAAAQRMAPKEMMDKKRKHASAPADPWPAAAAAGGFGGWGNEHYSEEGGDEDDDDSRRVRFASKRKGESDPWGTHSPAVGSNAWGDGAAESSKHGWRASGDAWADSGRGQGNKGWGDDKGAGRADTQFGAGWGDTKSGGGWGDNKSGGGWGDNKSGGGWGDNKSGGGWGDSKSGGGWGDSKSASGWDEPNQDGWATAWGSNSHQPDDGGWGSDSKKKDSIPRTQDTGYVMPSKTLTHAQKGTNVPLQFVDPHNKLNEYTNVKFVESGGLALAGVEKAFFGQDRKARERLRWSFSPDKDPRVSSVLDWIDAVAYSVGAYGLHKFLQSQERGALLVNAAYRAPKNPNEPAFDWMIFDELQKSKDKILQESVALYEPDRQVIVFVFLPSPSGSSVAIWRRKINIPNNIKLMLQAEIHIVLAGLRRETDYLVHVDEIPPSAHVRQQKQASSPYMRRGSIPPLYTAPDGVLTKKQQKALKKGKLPKDPNKKKRPWWKIF